MSDHADRTPHRTWVRVVAVVLAVALVLGAGYLAFTVVGGEPDRRISLGDTAAGMSRDTEAEQGTAGEREAAAQRFAGIYDGRARAELATYEQADESRGPVGPVNVIGVEIDGETDPEQLVADVSRTLERNGAQVSEADAGDDAEGVCATVATTTQCLWATSTSFGQVQSPTEGWEPAQLGALMRAVRADVETTD